MRFENMLAKKYIFSQKRHSLLTVCSIIASVAILTMMIVAYTTYMAIYRDAVYDAKPYHILISPLSEEKAEKLRQIDGIESVTLVQAGKTGKTDGRVMLKKYYEDTDTLTLSIMKVAPLAEINVNERLMSLDMIGTDAKANKVISLTMLCVYILLIMAILRLMIDTAFEVSSKERERQFGLLQSIGATPKQIVRVITREGLMLSAAGVPLGIGAGIGVAYAAYRAVLTSGVADAFFTAEKAEQIVHFHVVPQLLLIPAVAGVVWVLLSAYGTGMRVIKMSPVDAISARSKKVKKVRRHSLYGLLFGWTGKLASRNNRRQRKRFIITILSLTLSITLFASLGVVTKFMRVTTTEMLTIYDGFTKASDDFVLIHPLSLDDPTAFTETMELIEDSGYFDEIALAKSAMAHDPGDTQVGYDINYASRDYFDQIFGGKTDITYDELAAQGGYIFLTSEGGREFTAGETLELEADKYVIISDEEFEEWKSDKSHSVTTIRDFFSYYPTDPEVNDLMGESDEFDDESIRKYSAEKVRVPVSYTVSAVMKDTDVLGGGYVSSERVTVVFATLDTYIQRDCHYYGEICREEFFKCTLADAKQYDSAVRFLKDNSGRVRVLINNYMYKRMVSTAISALNIGITFVSALIAVIAIVNMINIISTGLLNRRGELAAMQCIGMTRRQLNKLTVIESLQYALIAGVCSTGLCELLILLTRMATRSVVGDNSMDKKLISFSQPLPAIWISAAAAFAVALLASFSAVSRMNRTPLIDQLRSPD